MGPANRPPHQGVKSRMNTCARRLIVVGIAALASTAVLGQTAQENAADAGRLIRILDVRPGSTVGEVGAGDGDLTFAMAKAVGDSGRVFTNELNKDRVKALQTRSERAGVTNVTVV